jgi:hypothetical protein
MGGRQVVADHRHTELSDVIGGLRSAIQAVVTL